MKTTKKLIKIPKVSEKESETGISLSLYLDLNLDWNYHVSEDNCGFSSFLKRTGQLDSEALLYDTVSNYIDQFVSDNIEPKFNDLKIKIVERSADSMDISEKCLRVFEKYNSEPEKEIEKQKILKQIKVLTDKLDKLYKTKE